MSELHIFLDESGNPGFGDNSSKRFILSFVFHDAEDDISDNLRKINSLDYFHLGPLVRREYPYEDYDLEARIKIFRKFFAFFMGLPIKTKSFVYEKNEFRGDENLFEERLFNDLHAFFTVDNQYLSSFDSIVIYYDMGQKEVGNLIKKVFDTSSLNFSFKQGVSPTKYRLFQVADLLTTLKLAESKMHDEGMTISETRFFGKPRRFKKNYLPALEKKEVHSRKTKKPMK